MKCYLPSDPHFQQRVLRGKVQSTRIQKSFSTLEGKFVKLYALHKKQFTWRPSLRLSPARLYCIAWSKTPARSSLSRFSPNFEQHGSPK